MLRVKNNYPFPPPKSHHKGTIDDIRIYNRALSDAEISQLYVINNCPDDPDKIEPGVCGCGTPDVDMDGDGIMDCVDIFGTVETWDVNGHTYEAVLHVNCDIDWDGTWEGAQVIAKARGGHLATITSQEEMDFVTQIVLDEWGDNDNFGAWLGAYQPAGQTDFENGWQWVTGEPWDYTNWDVAQGKPNNIGGQEVGDPGSLMMWGPYHSAFTPDPDKWCNIAFVSPYSAEGFVIEYND